MKIKKSTVRSVYRLLRREKLIKMKLLKIKKDNNKSNVFYVEYNRRKDKIELLAVPSTYENINNKYLKLCDDLFCAIIKYQYGFDIVKHAKDNNITYQQCLVLFSILHELGHIKYYEDDKDFEFKYYRDIEKHYRVLDSKYHNKYDFNKLYKNNTYKHHLLRAIIKYRNIPFEKEADLFAIDCMNKYNKELINIIK